MRRFFSVLCFILGAWLLIAEMFVAFVDADGNLGVKAVMVGIFIVLAAPFLLLGAWASPGDSWRDLGLTLLITVGFGVTCIVTIAAVWLDPAMRKMLPPRPDIALAPAFGAANLVAVTMLGWLLHRRGPVVEAGDVEGDSE